MTTKPSFGRYAVLSAAAVCAVAVAAAPALAQVRFMHQRMSHIYVTVDSPVSLIGIDPSVVIAGQRTKIKSPFGIAVDKRRGELIVANRAPYHGRGVGSIVRLTAGRGNIAPMSVIACRGFDPWAVTLDPRGNIVTGDLASSSVFTFARDANGCPLPMSRLAGPHTQLASPIGVAYDSHQRLTVLNFNSGIRVFAPGDSGDAAPIAAISGGELAGSEGLALDRADNIYVVNYSTGTLLEFAAGSNGNVAPIRTISGPHTMLRNPIAVAVDRDGSAYVADYGSHDVLVFGPTASGDASPATVLSTGQPTAIAVLP
jgi:DNA-binding beta-propeller fold protein YncE